MPHERVPPYLRRGESRPIPHRSERAGGRRGRVDLAAGPTAPRRDENCLAVQGDETPEKVRRCFIKAAEAAGVFVKEGEFPFERRSRAER